MLSKAQWEICLSEMERMFPDAHCELVHSNPFELLVATLLSAQCTDVLVNKVTPDLFAKYKSPEDYLAVSVEELQNDIRSIGLFRNKAKNIQALSRLLIDNFDGQVPADRELLTTFPGVGRKTANVVLSVAFDVPALAVDTHVERVSKRLGLSRWNDLVLQVQATIIKTKTTDHITKKQHPLIFIGRYHCKAQNPQCPTCPLLALCREGKKRIGRVVPK